MSDCPRVGKLFGGCKFEGRFSVNEGYKPSTDHLLFSTGPSPRAIPKKTVYVRDVCVTCGKTVERAMMQACEVKS